MCFACPHAVLFFSSGTGGRQDLRDPRDGHRRGRPANNVDDGQPVVPDTGGRGGSHYVVVVTAVRQRGQILLHGAVRSTRRGLRRVVLQLLLQEQMTRGCPTNGTQSVSNTRTRIFVVQDDRITIITRTSLASRKVLGFSFEILTL